jgi:hypothetical protein
VKLGKGSAEKGGPHEKTDRDLADERRITCSPEELARSPGEPEEDEYLYEEETNVVFSHLRAFSCLSRPWDAAAPQRFGDVDCSASDVARLF